MRVRHVLALVMIPALASAVALSAQARPDFSGAWVLERNRSSQTSETKPGLVVVSVTGLLGEKFTATQDAATLALDITALGTHVKAVYKLDGSESRNLNPAGSGQPEDPIFSRASWDGDKLVILTRGTALVNGKPTESRRVMWIDAAGLLTIERSSEGAPPTMSVYRRTR